MPAIVSKHARQLDAIVRLVVGQLISGKLNAVAAAEILEPAQQIIDAYPLDNVPSGDLARAGLAIGSGMARQAGDGPKGADPRVG